MSVVSRASSVHDIRSEEQPKDVKPRLTFKESKDQSKGLDIMAHESELKDERPLSRVPLAENSMPADVPLFSSTPGGAAVIEVNVKESSLDPVATSFAQATLPPGGDSQPGCVSPLNSTTEAMVTKLTASIDSIVTKSNLPPLGKGLLEGGLIMLIVQTPPPPLNDKGAYFRDHVICNQ